MPRVPAADEATALTTRDLRETGLTKRQIAEAVGRGDLIRLRLGRYAPAHTAHELVEAARWGGRLDCISLLAARGVFIHTRTGTHMYDATGVRRRSPRPRSSSTSARHSPRP